MNTTFMPESQAGMPGIHANTGGPMSRTRTEIIKSSLLGSRSGVVRCPRKISLCLRFYGEDNPEFDFEALAAAVALEEFPDMVRADSVALEEFPDMVRADCVAQEPELPPVERLESLLRDEGLRDPEELRTRYTIPQNKLICGPWTGVDDPICLDNASSHDVLEQALMLGLCTAQMYDPGRPVLWTETSLTRSVELFDPGSFYA